MSTYDLLMLAILVGLTLYGYFKGMAWQVAYVASFVASYFVAVRFADQLAPRLTFVGPPINKFVAMLIIYAVCSFAVWTLFRLVRGMIDSVKMDGFDHQMGALLGFARGVLWCVGVTFFAVTLLPATQKQQIVNSKSGYYIARLLDETDSLFPAEVHDVIGPYLDRLENELDGAQPPASGQPAAWPSSGSQPAPTWGAAAPTQPTSPQPTAPAWPSGNSAPAPSFPAWPQSSPQAGATQPAPQQPATSFPSWPAAPTNQPTAPAQPVSFPEWD